MKHILGPWLNKVLKDDYTDQPRLLAVLGFFRTDILIMKNNIILFIVSSVLLASILVSQQREPMEVLLTLLSYVVMSILLSLAIMFKYSTELSTRGKYFRSVNGGFETYQKMKNAALTWSCSCILATCSWL